MGWIKAYKGFNVDMTCRGFQYKEGEEYEFCGEPKLGKCGFHACEDPVDCFRNYNDASSTYHEVELYATDEVRSADSTRVGSKIRIGKRIIRFDMYALSKAMEIKNRRHVKDCEIGIEPKGDVRIYGGVGSVVKHLSDGTASSGDLGISVSSRGLAITEKGGVAVSDDTAIAGDYGVCVSRYVARVGKNGCAIVRSLTPAAVGDIGSVITLCKVDFKDNIVLCKTIVVDGVKYFPDRAYYLDGKSDELQWRKPSKK